MRHLFPAFSEGYSKGNKETGEEGELRLLSSYCRGEVLPLQLLSHTNTQGSVASWAL